MPMTFESARRTAPLPAAAELLFAHRQIEQLEKERRSMLEELEELRYEVAESKRATEERKALFLRELNKLRLERDTLTARLDRLEGDLTSAKQTSLAIVEQQSKNRVLKKGLAATGGLATATGLVSLAMLLKNAVSFGRRVHWFRHA
jgi:chromosome segregation ATPase